MFLGFFGKTGSYQISIYVIFRILVLGSRYPIPYKPNQIIFEYMIDQFVEDVLNSGEDAVVWLHTTAGLDIATPCKYF